MRGLNVLFVLCCLLLLGTVETHAVELVTTAYSASVLEKHQILRTSTGRLYFFIYYGTPSSGYSIIPYTSVTGSGWTRLDGFPLGTNTSRRAGFAIDSKNIIHVVTLTGGSTVYTRFHTQDSEKGNHAWDAPEVIYPSASEGDVSIAIDDSDAPHVAFTPREEVSRKSSVTTIRYADKMTCPVNNRHSQLKRLPAVC